MLRYLLLLFFSIQFLVISVSLPAQSFRYKQYTSHNGLPIDNVYAAAQDENGFMWFGTIFGISKFDGYRFVNYNKNNGIANKAVTDIVYAGGDSLLFLSYPNTIQSLHTNGKINTIAECRSFSMQQIVRHNDAFYFYQRTVGKVGLLKNGSYRILNLDSLFHNTGLRIQSVFSLQNKGVGFCTNKGLFIENNGAVTACLQNEDVAFAIYTDDKKITAVSNNTVVYADSSLYFTKTGFIFPNDISILHMAMEPGGATWFRGLDKGIYQLQDNKLQEISATLGLQNKIINEFFIDKSANTWFSTDGSGIILKQKNSFKNYETQNGLVNNRVLELLQYNNEILIGTSNGVSVKRGAEIRTVRLPENGKGLKYVYQLTPVNNAVGICINKTFDFDGKLSIIHNFVKPGNYDGYSFIAFNGFAGWQQNSTTQWVMEAGSLTRIINNKVDSTYQLKELGVRKVYDFGFYENKIWAGYDRGIVFVDINRISKLDSINGKPLGEVFQLLKDRKGNLWAATENGLMVMEQSNWRFIPRGNTYGSNYCSAIAEDNEGKIWCATWDGIFVTDGNNRISYGTSSGLGSKTCNAILFDSTNGELCIGTDNGLSIIQKYKLADYTILSKIFLSCTFNDSLPISNGMSLKSFQNNLRFYLSVPYYNGNDEIDYEYKLDNGEWMVTVTPVVLLSDISGGKHTLYARAMVNGRLITTADAFFSFTIKSPFYKTWWFWLPAAVLLQLIIILAINKYNKKIREQKLAAQQQQAELASLKQQAFTSLMNPHFIFNALNSIQHYINKQDRLAANKYLSDFATLVRRSFDAAQKAFVPLDEELETVRLYLQLEKMRFTDKFNYSITLNKEAEAEEWMLPGMVLQPFLENAILHGLSPLSTNGQLTITIKAIDNTLYITITDNGIGIDKSRLFRKDKKHSSRGMQLIKERLQILSKLSPDPIQLTITELTPGAENTGTCIQLVIPQQVYEAYIQNGAGREPGA